MKLKEKDRVLLIPDEFRDKKIGPWVYKWIVIIENLIWNSKIHGFIIKTYPHNVDLVKNYQAFTSIPKREPKWYIFPLPLDVWSNKLYNGNGSGLLENHHFGDSWLGSLLAYLWEIDPQTKISVPLSWEFQLTEIYLFNPKILTTLPFEPKSFEQIKRVNFQIYYLQLFQNLIHLKKKPFVWLSTHTFMQYKVLLEQENHKQLQH